MPIVHTNLDGLPWGHKSELVGNCSHAWQHCSFNCSKQRLAPSSMSVWTLHEDLDRSLARLVTCWLPCSQPLCCCHGAAEAAERAADAPLLGAAAIKTSLHLCIALPILATQEMSSNDGYPAKECSAHLPEQHTEKTH
jgi:hypothetical protein